MQIEVKDIQRKLGLTTIFVTHDQSEALSLSDRLAVMSEGDIRQAGTPQEIYANPADRFVASFVGDVNVIPGRVESLHGGHALIGAGQTSVRVPLRHLGQVAPGSSVDLFVRPEQLRLAEAGEERMLSGCVHAQIYQGGHTDILVDIPILEQSPIRIRLAGQAETARWPAGTPAGVVLASESAIAFPKAS
jgi:ABC-type Fe3+/spermidine/putrescine transport system ATPase subunit